MIKITIEQIEQLNPCLEGMEWYKKNGSKSQKNTLLRVNKLNPDWARWLYTKLMTVNQRRQLALFAAEQVLPIFEEEYPKDKRPRLAIKATKAVILADTLVNRKNAAYVARAAEAAAAYAYSVYIYAAANTAANVAAYAAANTAANVAYAADADYAATVAETAAYAYKNKVEMQILLINKALEILEGK